MNNAVMTSARIAEAYPKGYDDYQQFAHAHPTHHNQPMSSAQLPLPPPPSSNDYYSSAMNYTHNQVIATGQVPHSHYDPGVQLAQFEMANHAVNQHTFYLHREPNPHFHTLSDIETISEMESNTLPTQENFSDLLNDYIRSLSPKKRDKALIPSKRYENILSVLRDPKCTTIESAQFRFWAKKMFRLGIVDNRQVVLHEGKPVAVRESLYTVLMNSHLQAQHGGRDKTSAQVRKYHSWVPKELIARFVRSCPSCNMRRQQTTPPYLNRHTQYTPPASPRPGSGSSSSYGTISPTASYNSSPAMQHASVNPMTPNGVDPNSFYTQQTMQLDPTQQYTWTS